MFVFLLLGAAAGGAVGYIAGRQQGIDQCRPGIGACPNPNALPPPPPNQTPTMTPPAIGQYPGMLGVPASEWPIPGGSYITNIGWCPPGFVYDLQSKLCVPEITTQGYETGACCGSCAMGGPCEGCYGE